MRFGSLRRFAILLIWHTRRRICLNISSFLGGGGGGGGTSYFSIPTDDKFTSFYLFIYFEQWVALCGPISCEANNGARHWCSPGRELKRQRVQIKKQKQKKTPPRSESRTGEQTSSVWINTRKLLSRKAITCVNTDIHCNAPWRLISLCVCVSVYAKPGEEIKSFLLFLA